MVVAEDKAEAVRPQLDQAQAQRHFFVHGKAALQLLFKLGLQRRLVLGGRQVAPVEHPQGRLGTPMDNLHHALAQVPAERGTQDIMAGDDRLPGLVEGVDVDCMVDLVAVLHQVDTRPRFQQGVHQQPFLHGRQGVDIFDVARRHRQAIELCLAQAGQREISWGHALGAILQAVHDHLFQRLLKGAGQALDGLGAVHLAAIGPVQTQFAVIDLAVDAEPVTQRCILALAAPGAFPGRHEQRTGILAEAAVELPQVVEGHPWLGDVGQLASELGIPR